MLYAGLFLLLCVVWFLISLAGGLQTACSNVKSGHEVGGTSLLPGVLIFPAFFTGIAFLADLKRPHIGSWVITILHLVVGITATVHCIILKRRLRNYTVSTPKA